MSAVTDFMAAHEAHMAGDWARAERLYRGLRLSMPFNANHNLGVVLMAMGKFKAAEEAYNAALAAQPGDPRPLYGLSQLRLAEGDYAAGWPLWEARRGVPGMLREPPKVTAPEWQGEDLTGKRLLVAGEQGLGDHIMWARFFPALLGRGAKVVFSCPWALHPIFRDLGVELTGPDEEGLEGPIDCWAFQDSIAGRIGTTLATLPPPARLSTPPPTTGGGIGVVPTGSAVHKNNRQRSLSEREAQRLLKWGRDLRPEATGAKDFGATAEIVAGLDLVITVDTVMAHLAGSMGKPVWVLIPCIETDWRWLREREDSPWYPSARLFRQRTPGDWTPVFRRLESGLKAQGLI